MTGPRRKDPEATPRQYPSDTRRPTVTFRVRQDMVDKLKASAAEHDLSLSEEVERSLLIAHEIAPDQLVMRSIRSAIDMAEKAAGARWFENQATAKLVHEAIVAAAGFLILGDHSEVDVGTNDKAQVIAKAAVARTLGPEAAALCLRH